MCTSRRLDAAAPPPDALPDALPLPLPLPLLLPACPVRADRNEADSCVECDPAVPADALDADMSAGDGDGEGDGDGPRKPPESLGPKYGDAMVHSCARVSVCWELENGSAPGAAQAAAGGPYNSCARFSRHECGFRMASALGADSRDHLGS